MCHSVQENQLVWGGIQPQAFTIAPISLRSRQLVTLCATRLHRLAWKSKRETIWFSSLFMPPFMAGLESLWGEIYPILFLSFLGPSCNQRCLESALYLLSTIPEGVCSHTDFYSLPALHLYQWLGVTGMAANLGFLAAPPRAALGWWVIGTAWPCCAAHQGSNPINSLPVKCLNSHESFPMR